jgi:uncharacterized membrane protein YhaH (DUF805 family)
MFKNPFSFTGRIRRTEYGISYIIWAIIYSIIYITLTTNYIEYFFLLYVPLYWFIFAQGAKRCHDRGNSGWYQFIPFYVLWLLFAEGDSGENDYGTDPKGLQNLSSEVPIDMFAFNNLNEVNVKKPLSSTNRDEIADELQRLNSLIKAEKKNLFGSNRRKFIQELIENICNTKDDGLYLIEIYSMTYNKDLITELIKLSNSYNAIKENVQTFIDLGIVKEEYPHNLI